MKINYYMLYEEFQAISLEFLFISKFFCLFRYSQYIFLSNCLFVIHSIYENSIGHTRLDFYSSSRLTTRVCSINIPGKLINPFS